MSKDVWTSEEDEFLLSHADWATDRLAIELGRTAKAVTQRRYKFRTGWKPGKKRVAPKTLRPWTESDIGFIQENVGMSVPELASTLGRSVKAIRTAQSRIRNGWEPLREPWTKDEEAFLLASPHLTTEQAASHLGRTKDAVGHRRQMLRVVKGANFGEFNKSPHKIGSRPLIAKTCKACGLLLQADWFSYETNQGGKWRSRCKRCDPPHVRSADAPSRVAALKAGKSDSSKESSARLQRLSLPHAVRNGQPWMDADHVTLCDPDLTLFEKAIKLGRTYHATSAMCSSSGYRSKFGLGDPERDQWIIDNPNLANDGTLLVTVAPAPEPAETEQRQLEPMWA